MATGKKARQKIRKVGNGKKVGCSGEKGSATASEGDHPGQIKHLR